MVNFMSNSITNILFNPDAFFQEKINGSENLRIPALVVLATGIVGAVSAVLMAQLSAKMMSSMMPGIESIIMIAALAGALIGTFIFWLIWAGLIYGISSVFKGEGSFRRTLEFVGYGFLPQLMGSVITLIAAFEYLPQVHVTAISTAGSSDQLGQVVQNATNAMMHDPAMAEFVQVSSLVTIVFLLWSANIWIFGIRHARKLSPRDAALCVGIPVVLYVIFLIYKLGAQ
jgi:hypothetical protein